MATRLATTDTRYAAGRLVIALREQFTGKHSPAFDVESFPVGNHEAFNVIAVYPLRFGEVRRMVLNAFVAGWKANGWR